MGFAELFALALLAVLLAAAFGYSVLAIFESSPQREWRVLIDLLFKMGYRRKLISEILDFYC